MGWDVPSHHIHTIDATCTAEDCTSVTYRGDSDRPFFGSGSDHNIYTHEDGACQPHDILDAT